MSSQEHPESSIGAPMDLNMYSLEKEGFEVSFKPPENYPRYTENPDVQQAKTSRLTARRTNSHSRSGAESSN
jgi:hypothetical protein